MTKDEAKTRIEKLKKEIQHHRYQYHVLDKQTISDAALDSLKHELYRLEQEFPELITPDSPTQRVGGQPLDKFKKVTHKARMLSMEDVFSLDEMGKWYQRILKLSGKSHVDLFCMVKLDGLAISLTYKEGVLKTAATRGNGVVGEDVTQNVKTIESVPLSLREEKKSKWKNLDQVVVRGEVYFPLKEFAKLNKELKKKGQKTIVNPRNGAAGTIRQLDPKITASRPLDFFAWDVVTEHGQKTHTEEWRLLKDIGFKVEALSRPAFFLKDVQKFWQEAQKKREKLNYWIDGVVVRVDNNKLFNKLGVVGKTPRALVAWKFPAEEATTVVEKVEWFVGRTGALTPVAVVEPTFIAGTTVTHASLHNMDEIERLDVRDGDTVVLYKAGDIIPKVKEVLKNLRPKKARKIEVPKKCPVCGSSVKRKSNEVALYCTNLNCFAQDKEKILHAARAFEMDGFGPQTAATLLDNKIVQDAPDLFKIRVEDLLMLEGFQDLSANKLVNEIQLKKQISLDRFLVALGIRHVGAETALLLAEEFGSLENIIKATQQELAEVEGVGEVVAKSIHEFLSDNHNQEIIKQFQENGVQIKFQRPRAKGKFTGKSFVFTGTLQKMTRDDAKKKVRMLGAITPGGVSKKTDYVVVGKEPGSKASKAKKFGVTTLTENEFLTMIAK